MKTTKIIAEAGVNHNGSLEMALKLIDAAAEAGADFVKFQTFKSEKVISFRAPKAAYQVVNTGPSESQLEMVKKLELGRQEHETMIKHCQKRGIAFLSTPFDSESLVLLMKDFHLNLVKIPSGEITNAPFLLEIAQYEKPVILSTGMSNLSDIELGLGVMAFGYLKLKTKPSIEEFQKAYGSAEGQQVLRQRVTLLHCTTEYPTPMDEVNLRVMETLRQAFGLPVGYSDHTQGITIPVAAVALGACLIEKHFTLDRNLPGPDHKASLEPSELKAMVSSVRQVEKALGSTIKVPSRSEIPNRDIARKSLIAEKPIKKGQIFTAENLSCKRPGSGLSPYLYWSLLGRKAERDFEADELITES